MVTSLLGVWLMGCASQSLELELRVDGPARVRVDQLGPVEVPAVILADGTTTDVEWSVDAPGVVSVESGRVVAVGPGEARVLAEYAGQAVEWTLVVDPAVVLTFSDAPSTLDAGEIVVLNLSAQVGERHVDPGTVEWTSSDPEVASISQGEVRAHAGGVVYLTAKAHGSQAMVELEILDPQD